MKSGLIKRAACLYNAIQEPVNYLANICSMNFMLINGWYGVIDHSEDLDRATGGGLRKYHSTRFRQLWRFQAL